MTSEARCLGRNVFKASPTFRSRRAWSVKAAIMRHGTQKKSITGDTVVSCDITCSKLPVRAHEIFKFSILRNKREEKITPIARLSQQRSRTFDSIGMLSPHVIASKLGIYHTGACANKCDRWKQSRAIYVNCRKHVQFSRIPACSAGKVAAQEAKLR